MVQFKVGYIKIRHYAPSLACGPRGREEFQQSFANQRRSSVQLTLGHAKHRRAL